MFQVARSAAATKREIEGLKVNDDTINDNDNDNDDNNDNNNNNSSSSNNNKNTIDNVCNIL